MRRAIQLRMMFSLAREGGIEGEGRRKHHGDQVERGVTIVSGCDHHEMKQGVHGQETGAGDRRGPKAGPPGASRQREAGDKESRADVLRTVGTANITAIDLRMRTSHAPDEREGARVTGLAEKLDKKARWAWRPKIA